MMFKKNKENPNKIFCVSMQRNGTTSVGDFFKDNGYTVAGWLESNKNKWTNDWYDGNFDKIINSKDFRNSQVLEDDPWWAPEFYKYLFYKFPKSKFVLFTRDTDDWFKSMMSHSQGKTLGNTRIHTKLYRREKEFYQLLDNDSSFVPTKFDLDCLMTLEKEEVLYRSIYEIRNREIVDFFQKNAPKRLVTIELNDPDKWVKLGAFFKIKITKDYEIHSNKS
jgi:hypothetical protein